LEQCRLLGDKGDHFAVFSDVEFGDVAAIAQDLSLLNFIETRNYSQYVFSSTEREEGYRSSRDTMLVLPQPDEPTNAANLPFSIYNPIRTVQ
jgi:hypothetical protein